MARPKVADSSRQVQDTYDDYADQVKSSPGPLPHWHIDHGQSHNGTA